jgi:protein-disulfide isomerase
MAMHDEVFANLRAARTPEWRVDFAQRYGVEGAAEDEEAKALVQRIIQTGTEYGQTSEQFSHGIRSTPTMIINNRMIIGTLPIEQMRAIFQSLVDDYEQGGGQRFIENWVGPGD